LSAPCTDAAWSPDGAWMFVSANTGAGFHIWRQRFPDGKPEQLTAGATQEQGIAGFPDRRSLVTSVGVDQNTVWMHDSRGDRQITSQGYAFQPRLSPDRTKVYYLLRTGVNTRTWVSGALWVADLASGQRSRLFPDFLIEDYSISRDGTHVVFSAIAQKGASEVWTAALDGSAATRLSDVKSSRAAFGPDGDVFFVQAAFPDGANVYRIRPDGTGRRQAIADRVNFLYELSPDGKWAAVWQGRGVVFYPLDGGQPVQFCKSCGTVGAESRGVTPPVVSWSRDGTHMYVHAAWRTRETYVLPLPQGRMLPALPEGGIVGEIATLPGAQRVPQLRAFVTGDPSVYLFMRATSQRNIYQVPIP